MKLWQRCGSIIKPENVIYVTEREDKMINTFVAGLLCGWLYVTFVVPNYAIKEVQQCTLRMGKVLVQGDSI